MNKADRYLVLDFKDAGLFKSSGRSRDKSIDVGVSKERSKMQEFVEPITAQQIGNLLHVLFGKRPVPMNRFVSYKSDEGLLAKAKECLIAIHTPKLQDKYPTEVIQLKKAIYTSWSGVNDVTWYRLQAYIGDEVENFVKVMNGILRVDCRSKPFKEIVSMIRSDKYKSSPKIQEYFKHLATIKKKSLVDVLSDTNKPSKVTGRAVKNTACSINSKIGRTALTVYRDYYSVSRLSGRILVPVSKDDLSIIKANKGCATLLDGGSVFIRDVIFYNELANTNEFIRVGDISLEKKLYKDEDKS